MVRTVAVLLVAALATPSAATATHAPGIERSPAHGPAGTVTRVSASGFLPDEAVDVFLDTAELSLLLARADGTLAPFDVTIPRDAAPGRIWLSMIGRRSGLVAQSPFDVVASDWPPWPQEGADAAGSGVQASAIGVPNDVLARLGPAWTADGAGLEPLVLGRTVVLRGSGTVEPPSLSAVDAWTGEPRWTWAEPLSGPVGAAGSGDVLFVHDGRRLTAIDVATGAPRWFRYVAPIGAESAGRIAVDGGVAYLVSRVPDAVAPYGVVTAFDLAAQEVIWTRRLDTKGLTWPSGGAVVADGRIVVPVREGLVGLGAQGGALVWSAPAIGEMAGVAAEGDRVLATFFAFHRRGAGHIASLDAADGRVRWDVALEEGAQPRAPAVGDGIVVVGWAPQDEGTSGSGVSARRVADGQLMWRHQTVWPSAAAIEEGRVYVGTDDGVLHVYDLAAGTEIAAVNVGSSPSARPALSAQTVLLSSADGTLTALRPSPPPPPPRATLHLDPFLEPDPTRSVPARTQGWERVASLGPSAGPEVASVVPFDGALFVATRVATRDGGVAEVWRTEDGRRFVRVIRFAGAELVRLEAFKGSLFAATEQASGAALYVSTDGASFSVAPGFAGGPPLARIVPVASSRRLLILAESRTGPLAWSSDDGVVFRSLSRSEWGVTGTRLALDAQAPWGHGVVFDGARYVGAWAPDGGEIWRVDDTSIARVITDGLDSAQNRRLQPQVVYDGRLYVIASGPRGVEVLRTEDGTAYELVAAGGFGGQGRRNLVGSLAVVDDRLVLVTGSRETRRFQGGHAIETLRSHGFEVWISDDGATWHRVAEPGFGDPHDWMGTVLSEGGVLYLVGANHREGDAVWRSEDGESWDPLFREDASTPLSLGPKLTVFEEHLLFFHGDLEHGATIWRFARPVPVDAVPTTTEPAAGTHRSPVGIMLVVAVLVLGVAAVVLVFRGGRPGHAREGDVRHRPAAHPRPT